VPVFSFLEDWNNRRLASNTQKQHRRSSMTQDDHTENLMAQHIADHDHHRFQSVIYRENSWDLSHLDPFAFRLDIGDERHVAVIVLFSCHCFTHKPEHDDREIIPPEELYKTAQETRVLNEERYWLSKTVLTDIVRQLHARHITVADEGRNFVTLEQRTKDGGIVHYGIFFEVSKDKQRGGRIILRVQSAYLLNSLSKRLKNAKKVKLKTLVKAVYEGRKIKA
jgi:RNase P/RNase MRP subunit p29